jgi:periplasmic divalent cation tolerance protein
VGAPEIVVVLVTVPIEQTQKIARALVERKLAACVNVVPGIRSMYWWEGKVQDDAEDLLVIKTPREGFDRLRDGILELHPYKVPEVIALPVEAAHTAYIDWVKRSIA